MKYHLNYDHRSTNGIIFNALYPNGAMFFGSEFKPELSFEYDSFQWSEVFPDSPQCIELQGVRRAFTSEELAEVKQKAIDWVQALGQEGNPTTEQKAAFIRTERNQKLTACDWTQLADSSVDKQAWATYRQALRDVTAQAGFPTDVTWPTAPQE
jgi:hypothetical protein